MADIRPIDANALQFKPGVLYDDQGFSIGNVALRQSDIDAAPTLDYAPVRHGSVIETNVNGKSHRVFSCCGTDFTTLTMWMTPIYCPYCGAKMDKKEVIE